VTAAAALPPGRVLVVDDSDGIRQVFSEWLRRAGYTVIEAESGTEALSVISRSRFDLVLLDVHLPDMSGLEVCDVIKSSRATASIPVLHVSATAIGPNDRTAALNRGADGYLIEPIERDELLATVTSLLRYHDSRRTAERLAVRLERLHESTLLMNAASTISELLQFACAGLTSIFGTRAAVLVSREGIGRVAVAYPDQLDPVVHDVAIPDVLALASAIGAGPVTGLPGLDLVFERDTPAVVGSPVATPLGELIGAVLLMLERCPPEDELMLDHFAQALAVALENQRLYSLEHQIALTLQRALLPSSILQPDDVEIAVRYFAASDAVEVGGDFYEAIARDDGVTLVAVGDVVGHSLQAATVMAELRHTVRAFASLAMPMPEIIDRVATMLYSAHPGLTATVCLAEIDCAAGEVRVANAGHIPPVLRDGEGTRLLRGHGPLLGLRVRMGVPVITAPFGPGSTLVLVTDGLIERKWEDIDLGLERLCEAVARSDGDVDDLCDGILREVSAGPDTFDDVAILVARGR
jgi:serine phosphatase RsbU (regulator of sigma subunit)/DNA-binding response OmpR family regulator